MPSFVPFGALDVSSKWFRLDKKCIQECSVDTVNAVDLSARVKAIENCACHVGDAECYRSGEVERLWKRAKQLEARLPLQSTMVQIPYEATVGGFALFNASTHQSCTGTLWMVRRTGG